MKRTKYLLALKVSMFLDVNKWLLKCNKLKCNKLECDKLNLVNNMKLVTLKGYLLCDFYVKC